MAHHFDSQIGRGNNCLAEKQIEIKDADSATLYLAASTNYNFSGPDSPLTHDRIAVVKRQLPTQVR